jgi:hypothetical protein
MTVDIETAQVHSMFTQPSASKTLNDLLMQLTLYTLFCSTVKSLCQIELLSEESQLKSFSPELLIQPSDALA